MPQEWQSQNCPRNNRKEVDWIWCGYIRKLIKPGLLSFLTFFNIKNCHKNGYCMSCHGKDMGQLPTVWMYHAPLSYLISIRYQIDKVRGHAWYIQTVQLPVDYEDVWPIGTLPIETNPHPYGHLFQSVILCFYQNSLV